MTILRPALCGIQIIDPTERERAIARESFKMALGWVLTQGNLHYRRLLTEVEEKDIETQKVVWRLSFRAAIGPKEVEHPGVSYIIVSRSGDAK